MAKAKTAGKAKRGKGSDVIRSLSIDRHGKTQTFNLPRKAIEQLSKQQARDYEEGFVERARDFNQGRDNSELEVPSKSEHFWKGYRFAQAQEPAQEP